MFRSMSRVVVVAIVVFAFAVASLPAYAAPFGEGKAAAKAESGWFQSAVAWLSRLITGRQPSIKVTATHLRPMTGPCVDPLGRCGW